jgi:hypothetical protein
MNNNILLIIIALLILCVCIYFFLNLGKEKQMQIIKEWLLLAVIRAEKELGGGTGQIKLRFVYDLFLDKFKVISYIISFDQFSKLVDESLDIMKTMISNNKNVENYISQ